jgi:hypothetical protein
LVNVVGLHSGGIQGTASAEVTPLGPFPLRTAARLGTETARTNWIKMDPLKREFGFYAFVAGCLISAILITALTIGEKIGGERVAQVRTHSALISR